MRKILLIIIIVFHPVFIWGGELNLKLFRSRLRERYSIMIPEIKVSPDKEWTLLIRAIHHIESNEGKKLVGDGGKALGPLQIHKGMIDLVNKIQSEHHFTYKDRLSYQKSLLVFQIFQDKYNPEHNLEIASKIWNGGSKSKYPDYSTSKSTRRTKNVQKYWGKVKNKMDQLRDK